MLFSPLLRASLLCAAAVCAGAVLGTVLASPELVLPASEPADPEPAPRVLAMRGESPLAPLGVRPGDRIESVERDGDALYLSLLRDGARLRVVARGVRNPFPTSLNHHGHKQ